MELPFLSETSTARADLNRAMWTVGKSFLGFGVRFGLRSNNAERLEHAIAERPLGWQEIPNGKVDVLYSFASRENGTAEENHLLFADDELVAQHTSPALVLREFARHAQLVTAWHARERLFVHAGVVGWQGHAILIPGRSLSGKTRLVQALVQAGATYYSDEFAVLDRAGCTHPYPLPLSIRAPDGAILKTPATALGGQVGTEPLPVTLILLTRYVQGAQWDPRPLSPAQAMLALMDNTVAARREPEFSMPVLRATVRHARTVKGVRGDAQSILPAIHDLVTAK